MKPTDVYLGDGLYASFDGFQIRLWTERSNGVHEVYLEPNVLERLDAFVASLREPVSMPVPGDGMPRRHS